MGKQVRPHRFSAYLVKIEASKARLYKDYID